MRRSPLLLAALILWAPGSQGAQRVWLVGGGSAPDRSQAQIEQNVIWVQRVLGNLVGTDHVQVYFDDGDTPVKDVKEWRAPAEEPATLQPLARAFDEAWSNGLHYRRHRVPRVAGTTRAPVLQARLREELGALKPGDRGLFVFIGHGGRNRHDSANNTIELWGDTVLTAREVGDLFAHAPAQVPLRFVLTQCYSGAFARLARGDNNRCGFLSVGAQRTAEGCSPSVEAGDYRDYSTYFFAALAGKGRLGEPLAVDPDRDGDGRVSLREAHLYALQVARSSDVPRATSEVYLDRWAPWYESWLAPFFAMAPDNEYRQLAKALSEAQGLGFGAGLERRVRAARVRLRTEIEGLDQQRRELARDMARLRESIEDALLYYWPTAGNPYTLSFRRFLEDDLDQAQAYIMTQPGYPALVEKQALDERLLAQRLDAERALAQLEKIERMMRLARLQTLFAAVASPSEHEAYQRLLACEEQGL